MGDYAVVLDLVTKAGPWSLFALMFWLFRLERQERLDSQKRERELALKILQSMTKATNAIRSLRYVFLNGKAPDPRDYEAEDVSLE